MGLGYIEADWKVSASNLNMVSLFEQKVQQLELNMAWDLKLRMWGLGNRAPADNGGTGPVGRSYLVVESSSKSPLDKPSQEKWQNNRTNEHT